MSNETNLRRKVTDLTLLFVVNGHRFDASEDDVFGDLHSESTHSRDENIGRGHSTHGIVTQDIAVVVRLVCQFGSSAITKDLQLSGVKAFVDVVILIAVRVDYRTVGRHFSLKPMRRRNVSQQSVNNSQELR